MEDLKWESDEHGKDEHGECTNPRCEFKRKIAMLAESNDVNVRQLCQIMASMLVQTRRFIVIPLDNLREAMTEAMAEDLAGGRKPGEMN